MGSACARLPGNYVSAIPQSANTARRSPTAPPPCSWIPVASLNPQLGKQPRRTLIATRLITVTAALAIVSSLPVPTRRYQNNPRLKLDNPAFQLHERPVDSRRKPTSSSWPYSYSERNVSLS